MQAQTAKAELHASVLKMDSLSTAESHAMFMLYRQYYSGTSETIFFNDLAGKDYVLLLRDEQARVHGFTTLAIIESSPCRSLRAIFSGDTIVAHDYWGQQKLAFTWLRFAGQIKAQAPTLPLYWFLIVKGHRTYRYLSAFSKTYYPHHDYPTPPAIRDIMNDFAYSRFGDYYDERCGLIRFPQSRGHLQQDWAHIPAADMAKAEVQYFLQCNPHYHQGDELVCLTELTPENLKPLSRRVFVRGMKSWLPVQCDHA